MRANVPTRSIYRWIHIIISIPIYGYIYSPFEKLPQYAPPTRFIFFPLMVALRELGAVSGANVGSSSDGKRSWASYGRIGEIQESPANNCSISGK
jgi:hypothetical protein